MFVKHVRLKNFLSFGPQEMSVDLKPLNVLIGPNGSGKSNFLEVFELLRNASGEIAKPIRQGGGISEWLWKNGGAGPSEAMVDIVVDYHPRRPQALRYGMSFTEAAGRFKMLEEWIENDQADPGCDQPYFYYRYNQGGRPMIGVGGGDYRSLQREDVALDKSILAQLRDPDQFPEMTYLGKKFEEIRLFRPWSFAAPRLPQKTDQPNNFLSSDAANLCLVLNLLQLEPGVKLELLEALRQLYDGIDDYGVLVEGGTIQVFFQEGRRIIPAARLSDGTMRYLSLLAILLHPSPPPLICIDAPESGLHPDIIPTLARLLQKASTRTQLIVATHSESLVDAFTETPEAVLVCERAEESGAVIKRLDAHELKPWLEKYSLGHLWLGGNLGGVRW